MTHVRTMVNGDDVVLQVEYGERLLDVLRDRLGLTGTKEGCGTGSCGACTVWLDGLPVNSCLVPVGEIEGSTVTTIEGVASAADPHAVQLALADVGGLQCGFCTPGVVMAVAALLEQAGRPGEAEIRAALSGNLCRCTGYDKIVAAVVAVRGVGHD